MFKTVLYTVSTVVSAYWMVNDIYQKHKRYKERSEYPTVCKECGSF